MALIIIDGELCVVENEEVTHVFERGNLSRSAYKHMCSWVQTNFSLKLNIHELWEKAQEAWDNLSEQNKMCIWSVCQQEKQNAQDIRDGLLANLKEYQGYSSVKNQFSEAIERVFENF